MPHSAEIIGLAGFTLADATLHELDAIHPGIRARALQRAIIDLEAEELNDPGGNAAAILAVLRQMNR